MEAVPSLAESGVTDCVVQFALPGDARAAEDSLRSVVEAFRAATGRSLSDPRGG
jgi:hypothetical protein